MRRLAILVENGHDFGGFLEHDAKAVKNVGDDS